MKDLFSLGEHLQLISTLLGFNLIEGESLPIHALIDSLLEADMP